MKHPSIVEDAVKKGDTTLIHSLLKDGLKLTDSSYYGEWLLSNAGSIDMFNLLLRSGIDPNIRSGKNRTLMMYSISDTVKASLLLGAGADLSIVDHEGMNALHYAASRGEAELFRWLLEKSDSTLQSEDLMFYAIGGQN